MHLDPVVVAATGILAAVGSDYIATRPEYTSAHQRWAEWAAWGLLALGSRLELRRKAINVDDVGEKEAQGDQTRRLGELSSIIIAALLVASQYVVLDLGRSTVQPIFPLIPLLAVLLRLVSLNRVRDSSSPWYGRLLSFFDDKRSAIAFLGGCFLLPFLFVPSDGINTSTAAALAMTLFLAGAMAYSLVSLDEISTGGEGYQSLGFSDHLQLVQSISSKAFIFCTVYLAVLPVKAPFGSGVLGWALVLYRFSELSAILWLCFNHAAITATAMFTPGAAIISTLVSSESWPRYLIVTAGSIGVLSSTLPKSATSRRLYLLGLLAVPIVGLLFAYVWDPSRIVTSIGPVHPIQRLFDSNWQSFEIALSRQSRTVGEAVVEYRRRYGRSPPLGFDRWFEIAQEKEFQLIDEFDTIMETMEPFWGLNPESLRRRVDAVTEQGGVVECLVNKTGLSFSPEHHYAAMLQQWVDPDVWGDILPEIKFVISAFDEPRVVAPYDTLDSAMEYALKQKAGLEQNGLEVGETSLTTKDDITWISIGKQNTLEGFLSSCHLSSPARSGKATPRSTGPLSQLPFVNNVTTAMDVCASADRLHGHGVLVAPDTMIITHSLVPILSQCKPSVFSDVLYPSPYYGADSAYPETDDVPWDHKADQVYWAGTATGGYSRIDNWRTLHRQRLTLMTEPGSNVPAEVLTKDKKGNWHPFNTTYAQLADLFHLRVTRVVQCEEAACEAMKDHFKIGETLDPGNAPLLSKYALDIDGNAYSGRYYKLLKSNSAVLKHTSFREWHDGRLQPWVHFIPVSAGAEELGEIMRFLVHEDEGKEIGKQIAEQGRDWARKTLRPLDLEVVFIRVLLEYARLMSDERESMNFG